MKLKYLLTLFFFALIAIQVSATFLSIHYLQESRVTQYRALKAEQLETISSSVKRTILLITDRLKESAQLVASRTQLRISLQEWQAKNEEKDRVFITRIIHDAKQSLNTVHAIHIYDKQMRLVSSTDASLPVGQLMKRGIVGKMVLHPSPTQTLMLSYTTPLFIRDSGIGYAHIIFDAQFIDGFAHDRTGLGQTGEWIFAARQENGDALFVAPLKYDREAAFKRTVSSNTLETPIIQALTGREGIMNNAPDYAGNRVMASTRYIDTLQWGIVAKINESELDGQLGLHLNNILLLEIVVIFMAICLSLMGVFIISRPIEMLNHYIKLQTDKEYQPDSLPNGGWQETRELANSFDSMINYMKNIDQELDHKVAIKTKGLTEANTLLKELAFRDPLTGLYNRRYMLDRIISELNQIERYDAQFALAIFDIDHFKSINDRWGHTAGDHILTELSGYLKGAMRKADVVGRIGGEEFLMLLPYSSMDGARSLVERFREEIAKLSFQFNEEKIQITVSFGVSILTEQINSVDEWIDQADKALYKAKNGGRNQVAFFEYEAENA